MDAIARNVHDLTARVARAAARAGRGPAQIAIVAVAKTRSVQEVEAVIRAGLTDVGENRVQEAAAKRAGVSVAARWHLVGQLQRNKVGQAVDVFDVVQSVDGERLADALDRRAGAAGRRLEALLQVNTARAPQQGGVAPGDLPRLVDHVASLGNLRVRGLMTIAQHSDDVERVRGCFRLLRELACRIVDGGIAEVEMSVLSMGMSSDFELAVEEGSTMIRVGSALFGPRA